MKTMKCMSLLVLVCMLCVPLCAYAADGPSPTGDTENVWIWVSVLLAGVDLFLGTLLISNRRPAPTARSSRTRGRR